MPRSRKAALAATGWLVLTLSWAGSAGALTPEKRCEAMKLAALGKMLSTKLQCHAWATASEAPPEPSCFEHAERVFAEQLQGPDGQCSSDEERTLLLTESGLLTNEALASVKADASATLDVTGVWLTDAVIDLNQSWAGTAIPPPDVSACRRAGKCPENILILECRTSMQHDETGGIFYDSFCATAPESGYDFGSSAITSDVTQIGPLTYRVSGSASIYDYQLTLDLDESLGTYTGVGSVYGGQWTLFVTGRRAG